MGIAFRAARETFHPRNGLKFFRGSMALAHPFIFELG